MILAAKSIGQISLGVRQVGTIMPSATSAASSEGGEQTIWHCFPVIYRGTGSVRGGVERMKAGLGKLVGAVNDAMPSTGQLATLTYNAGFSRNGSFHPGSKNGSSALDPADALTLGGDKLAF